MYIFYIILYELTLYLHVKSSGVAPSHLLVTRVGPCQDIEDVTITVSEMFLSRKEFKSSLSGTMNLTTDIANGWSVRATMQKCHDIRNLDTCDFYKSLSVVSSGCTVDEEDDDDRDLYTTFFQYVQPELKCPLTGGSYTISEYPFFTEDSGPTVAEARISTSVFGYTYRLEGFDSDFKEILCVDAYLQLQYVREHDWVGDMQLGERRAATYSDEEIVSD